MPIPISDCWPAAWKGLLDPQYPIVGIGYDVATTTKKKSNPSSIAITQKRGLTYRNVAAIAFKTDDPEVPLALIKEALDLPNGLRVRKLCIDATNERFFATSVRSELASRVATQLIINSESLDVRGESMSWKHYLGTQLVNAFVDGLVEMPNEEWCKKMIRQVYTEGGSFAADVDESGNHADYFDALKLSIEACGSIVSSPAEAQAVGIGTLHKKSTANRRFKNPLLKFNKRKVRWS